MSTFGALQRLETIASADYPQLVCGRILPFDHHVLVAPISGKPCVYYEAFVEELQERTDENGLMGIPDPDEANKVWVPLFREAKAADFALVDPDYPSRLLYVPGGSIPINVLANEDTITRTRLRSKLIIRDLNQQLKTKEFLTRANVSLEGKKKTIRFREANFEQGEQIAVLGVIQRLQPLPTTMGTQPEVLTLKAVTQSVLTEEFFDEKGLSEWDRLAWKELTAQPCLVVTDMQKYFQGLLLRDLAENPELPKSIRGANINPTALESQEMQR